MPYIVHNQDITFSRCVGVIMGFYELQLQTHSQNVGGSDVDG